MNAIVTRIRTEAEAEIERLYQTHGLPAMREAWQLFESAGLPHRRVEAWHYTDLRARLRNILPMAEAPSESAALQLRGGAPDGGIGGYRLVFIDGHFCVQLSDRDLPAGVKVATQVEAAAGVTLAAEAALEPMLALNGALLQGAVTLTVTGDVAPLLHVIHLVSGEAATRVSRVVVKAEASARATILETFVNGDAESQSHSPISRMIAE